MLPSGLRYPVVVTYTLHTKKKNRLIISNKSEKSVKDRKVKRSWQQPFLREPSSDAVNGSRRLVLFVIGPLHSRE